jgi:Clp amino terminal domain, pathogenicity island component
VLYNLGVSLDDVGRRAQSTPSRDHWQAGKRVFSANAKRALELATYEAQRASHGYLGTVHLLLGLVAEDRGTAGEALSHLGITLSAAREETYRLLR